MQNFTLSGNHWFDSLSQPAMLVQNGTLFYFNAAAQALFAQTDTPLTDGGPVPDVLPEGESDCVTEVTVSGRRWSLLMRKQKAGTVCLFTPAEPVDHRRMAHLATQLRMRLSTLTISAEGLQNSLGEFWQKQNERWIACQNQSLYQLLRLTEELEFYGQTEDDLRILYQPSVLNLTRLGQDLTLLLTPLSEEAGHTFSYVPPKEDLFVAANEELMRKLVYQLVANAFHAGGDVTMKLQKRSSYAVLTLSDNGSGISGQVYSSLFSPEQRNLEYSSAGFGLGLLLCQRIATLYSGRLVVSPRKKGTQVALSLPLLQSGTWNQFRAPAPLPPEEISRQILTELSGVLPYRCFRSDDVG